MRIQVKRYILGSKPCSRAFTAIGHGKQTTMTVETHHKYSINIGSLCNFPYGTICLHRDLKGICENLKAMKQSIEHCFL